MQLTDTQSSWYQRWAPPSEFISFLKPKLTKFIIHNFEAKWQYAQFKSYLDNLTKDQIVIVINFIENYSFKEKNEIQNQHWYSWQVTILVYLTFRIKPNWDGIDLSYGILTKYHFYVSCCNPSLGLATKTKACKGVGQKESPGITFHVLGSARECEGMNPHAPKWALTFGVGFPMDSWIFRKQFQGTKPIGLKSSLYH